MMPFRALVLAAMLISQTAIAASSINTLGSNSRVAIAGYDAVAFFTEKKALQGKAEHSLEWMGAVWHFVSAANMEAFKSAPVKYAPQYGGHCAWGISENLISPKAFAGTFDIIDGKLYLFSPGNRSPDSAKTSFWQTGGGPARRLPEADKNWVALKARLQAR